MMAAALAVAVRIALMVAVLVVARLVVAALVAAALAVVALLALAIAVLVVAVLVVAVVEVTLVGVAALVNLAAAVNEVNFFASVLGLYCEHVRYICNFVFYEIVFVFFVKIDGL